ncbi:MAG: hypothetical protein H6R46_255 [Proteobacteria bacterium]|nr:hypothetical protein [Pseudomonadota bacterium]
MNQRRGRQRLDDALGQFARLDLGGLGQRQRHVAGEVTVLLGACVLDFHLHGGIVRQTAFGLQAGDGRVQQAFNVRFQTGSL